MLVLVKNHEKNHQNKPPTYFFDFQEAQNHTNYPSNTLKFGNVVAQHQYYKILVEQILKIH